MLYKDIKKHNCRDPFPQNIPNTMSITMSINIFSSISTVGLPSGYVKIAIEHGHRNSGFSH